MVSVFISTMINSCWILLNIYYLVSLLPRNPCPYALPIVYLCSLYLASELLVFLFYAGY